MSKSYKVCCLGDGGVGKTAITIQMCCNHFVEEYDPTIEDSYRKQVVIDDEPCVLEVLDTAGQDEFSTLQDQMIRIYEGFLIIYAINNVTTFSRVQEYKDRILRVKDVDSIPIILIGNKADLTDRREVSADEGEALARKWGTLFKETSAKTRMNVEQAFFDLVRLIGKERQGQPPTEDTGSPKIPGMLRQKKRWSCNLL